MKNEDNGQEAAKLDNKSNIDQQGLIVEPATAVVVGDVASYSNWETTSALCPTPQPDSFCETRTSYDKEDEITDEDIALFFDDRPLTSNIPESCTHVYCVQQVPESGINVKAPCAVCNSTEENWICLTCYEVYCSRYVNKHMVEHTQKSQHTVTLSLRDVSVWCYSCDDYVYDEVLQKITKVVLDAKYGSPTEVLTTATPF